jgi:hypothetical protein
VTVAGLPGTRLIAAERNRQKRKEGWTAAHDDGHDREELARAAACYALPHDVRSQTILGRPLNRILWPWDSRWWKPVVRSAGPNPIEARIAELVKAGALIAAEIDRLQRLT